MACARDHAHLIVFAHVCGYYSKAATIGGMASIRINMVRLLTVSACVVPTIPLLSPLTSF